MDLSIYSTRLKLGSSNGIITINPKTNRVACLIPTFPFDFFCNSPTVSTFNSSRKKSHSSMGSFGYSTNGSLPPYNTQSSIITTEGTPDTFNMLATPTTFNVLSSAPLDRFQCSIAFTIYCGEKTRRNSTNWIAVRSKSDLSLSFHPTQHSTLLGFQQMVADKCSEDYNRLGHIINKGTTSSPPTITWNVYILNNKMFPKRSPHTLIDNASFNEWISQMCSSKSSKGGVIITMANPRDALVHACKEDLVAKTIKRIEARHNGPASKRVQMDLGDSDADGSSDVEFDDLDVYVDQIYAKYGMNTKYDRLLPVYPDPTNVNRFILLTAGNVDIWAKALATRVAGVSLTSPPNTLKYNSCSKTVQKDRSSNECSTSTQALADLSKWLADQKSGHRPASPPSSVHGGTPETLADYLHFVSIPPRKHEDILNTLLDNDIDDYLMFKSLTIEVLKSLGFNVGVITKLCSNVAKFRNHLSRNA